MNILICCVLYIKHMKRYSPSCTRYQVITVLGWSYIQIFSPPSFGLINCSISLSLLFLTHTHHQHQWKAAITQWKDFSASNTGRCSMFHCFLMM